MCKFTNRLFVFTLLALFGVPRLLLVDTATIRAEHKSAADAKILDLLPLNDYENNYDVHYDQRQKGNENLRVKMDSFFIEMPPEDTEGLAEDILKEILSYALFHVGGEELLFDLADAHSSSSSTESTDKTQQNELRALKENKLESSDQHFDGQQQRDGIEEAPKNEVEGRNAAAYKSGGLLGANREPESKRVGAITKQHFNTLLNLLKRMRRN
ncbi:uncharacterized protein LOC129247302 [Anastrepha obliqua]|uniref:uncharacterized protein LOC129247302 n=1 Tax=Anastrepha obliqua TaxID=95512 RepID=UPI00240990D7|nr:uncharacterized protein LOC129247302 [Anastrepha obliqua]